MSVLRFLPLLLAMTVAGASPPPEKIKFQFRPATGSYVETVRIWRALQLGDGENHEEVTDLERTVTVSTTGDGYRYDIELTGVNTSVGDKGKETPLAQRLEFALMRFEVDKTGELLDVVGYDEAVAALREKLSVHQFTALRRTLDPDALARRTTLEWQGRVADLAGNEYELGEILSAKRSYDLETGDIAEYHVAIRIDGKERCGKTECARIELAYATDPADFADFVGATEEELREALGSKGREPADISGGGTRLVEIDTLRLRHEETRLVVSRMVTVPGEGLVVLRNEERRETSCDYGSQGGE